MARIDQTLNDPKNGTRTPVPDPTILTTQQLIREVDSAREILETRFNGMDKAIELLQKATDKTPCTIKDAVDRLQELHQEKFDSIATQFVERDTRTESTARDSKIAIDAALQAAKEAVGKTEISFTKQIDAIGFNLQTMVKAIDDKFDDMKGRLTLIEGQAKGVGMVWGFAVGAVGMAFGIVGVISFILKYV
jgi:hypothetical protein